MSSPLPYQYHLDKAHQLVNRLYQDLEKYAKKEDANEIYISKQNEVIGVIVDFINASEATINEVFELLPEENLPSQVEILINVILTLLNEGGPCSFFEKITILRYLFNIKTPPPIERKPVSNREIIDFLINLFNE
jgi:hypothetical protein